MRFASLGSGSEGNALLIEKRSGTTTTRVLLDCGFSAKEIERRLLRLGIGIDEIDAILITHEHSDHIGSALTLARKRAIPLYMSWGTARAVGADALESGLHVLWGTKRLRWAILASCLIPFRTMHASRCSSCCLTVLAVWGC